MSWLRDSLFWRLFFLMWVALVVSHFAAFALVVASHEGPRPPGFSWRDVPTLPSLPPMRGLPEGPRAVDGGPPPAPFGGPGPLERPGRRPGLPTPLLVLDYAVRLVVIAAAAALGARWLAAPMGRLVDASRRLGASLGSAAPLPALDEGAGTVEVREAARVFNRMASELDAQFKGRGLLVASLSHDLKTPITRMRMRLETEPPGPAAQRSIADLAEMSRLLDESLEVFRSDASDEPAQAVDMQALLQSIADDFEEQGQAVAVAGSAALAQGRPLALRRVFDNLVGNALRYATRVEVSVMLVESTVRVSVEDDGPGIAPALLEAVFQPYVRVEASRNRASGGSGLGLYIVRDLLRRQGGSIVLSNRPQGGLRAVVTLLRATA